MCIEVPVLVVRISTVKPLLGTKTYARQAAGILVKLKIKKGDVTNIQRLKLNK